MSTARLYTAKLRVESTALELLDDEGREALLDGDVKSSYPEAVRVDLVVDTEDHGRYYLESRYVFVQRVPSVTTRIETAAGDR